MGCCNSNCHNIPELEQYSPQDSAIALILKVYRYAKQLGDLISELELGDDDDIKKIYKEISRLDVRIDNIPALLEKYKVIIDAVLTKDGKNPVEGGAIYNALEQLKQELKQELKELGAKCDCVIDDELSETSDNAVKNKVIALAIKDIKEDISNLGTTTETNIKVLTVYRISNTKPGKPVGGEYDFVTGVFRAPSDWFKSVDPEEGDIVWSCIGIAYSNSETIDWQDPFRINGVAGGTIGPENVVTARVPIIYKSSITKPDTPIGGTYNFENDTFTAPNGWKIDKSDFTDDDVIWMSIGSATSDDTDIKWSEPIRITGGSGSSILQRAKILIIYTSSVENPGIPSGGSYDFDTENFEAPINWQTEDNFPEGSVVWMSIGTIYQGDENIDWSEPIRTSGGAGSSIIRRSKVLSIYKASPTTPLAPSGGSYDFNTNTLTPPDEWTEDSSSFEDEEVIWLSIGNVVQGDNIINWSNPLRITPGVGSANITVVFVAAIYINSETKPDTPTGGSYDFETKELTPPVGWSKDALTGDNAWFSARVFYKNGTETAWSEPKPAASADVTLTAANLEVIAQHVKLTSNELDIIAGKVNLDSQQLNIISQNVRLTTDNLETIADNINVSAINLDVLAQKITLTTQELNTIAANVNLQANQLDIIASKVKLDAQDLQIVSEHVSLTTDQLKVIADNINLQTIDYSVLAKKITLTSSQLSVVASNVKLTSNELSTIARNVTLNTQQLSVIAGSVKFTSNDLQVVADKITLNTAELNTIASKVTLTTAQLNTIAKNITLKTEDINAIAKKVTLSTEQLGIIAGKVSLNSEQLAVVAGKVSLTSENINTIASKVSFTTTQLNTIASKVNLTTDQLKIIAGNAKVTVSDSQIISAIGSSTGAASAIIQAINNGTSSVKISADKINLDGDVIAKAISAKALVLKNGSYIGVTLNGNGSGSLSGGKISWTSSGTLTVGGWTINDTAIIGGNTSLYKDGNIVNISSNTTYWKLGKDGSGLLARGNISWNVNGDITIGGTVNIRGTITASGLCLASNRSSSASSNINPYASGSDVFVYTGSSATNYFLPNYPNKGAIKFIHSINANLTIQGNGHKIYYNETSGTSLDLKRRPCVLFYDGTDWHAVFDH